MKSLFRSQVTHRKSQHVYRVGHSEGKKNEWAGQGACHRNKGAFCLFVFFHFKERPFTSLCLVLVVHTAAQINNDRLSERRSPRTAA